MNEATEITCANCGESSTNPGQFLGDGRWVCCKMCKSELADAQSYDDLAASGGIVEVGPAFDHARFQRDRIRSSIVRDLAMKIIDAWPEIEAEAEQQSQIEQDSRAGDFHLLSAIENIIEKALFGPGKEFEE